MLYFGFMLAALLLMPKPQSAEAATGIVEEPTMSSASQPSRPANHLKNATSPYLLQHAHNPVDWHEWCPDALEQAKREGKPIFLSIGYAACHWCHVMAHESFEDEEIAAVMNDLFVNIKVDREERPDLDDIYMQATIAISGGGGWPMSVWLTPDLKPFFAGTYFPPRAKYGRMGFKDLCERIGELWRTQRDALEADANKLSDVVRGALASQPATTESVSLSDIDAYLNAISSAFDRVKGGVSGGGPNKFPPSMLLELLMRSAARQGLDTPNARRQMEFVELTLDQMATGGVYDQLGGGIHRYSTDPEWHVPHFEKMLYDQALVSSAYVNAYALTNKPLYARIAREIFDYVLADLRSPDGGFYSTRDADSEGEEGKYFVWTREEIIEALGQRDAELFCSYYDVSATGNWDDPHAPGVPKNILRVLRSIEAVASLNQVEPAALERTLAAARRKLLDVRAKRVPPALDDKILAEWNGLMISSLARGGATLNEPRYLDAARKAADFVLTRQMRDGRLLRAYRDGRRLEMAFLTDYACMIEGLLDLYEATFERRWYDAAMKLNTAVVEHYWDKQAGGFFFTPNDHEELLTRAKDMRDSATPSGNSVQLMNLLRLATMSGDAALREKADRITAVLAPTAARSYGASERFLAAVEYALTGPVEIAFVGDPADSRLTALLRVAHESYLPNRALMLRNPAKPSDAPDSPLLAERGLVNGAPAAYVCRNYACQTPATTSDSLRAKLNAE